MNSRLVICLFCALLAGLLAAGATLSADMGYVLAFLIYSVVGSCTLVALTLAWPERRYFLLHRMEPAALA